MPAETCSGGSAGRIVPCRREDLPQVEVILRKTPEAASWSEASLAAILEENPEYFLLSWEGEDLGGFIYGRRVLDEGEILNLAVGADFRRRGIGASLVTALCGVFGRDCVRQVFLEVRSSNRPAVKLYTELGFLRVGKRPGYYRNPEEAALVLRREIA